jgi:replicative DNA helicase
MDIEIAFISKILETQDLKTVIDNKITPDFLYGKGKMVYDMFIKHYREYRTVPSIDAIKRDFPEFVPETSTDPLPYFIDQLRKRHKYNTMVSGLKTVTDSLGKDIDKAELLLVRLVSKIATEIKVSRDINYAQDIEDRIERYLHKKKHHGIDGIPTLIAPVDDITGGAHGGELITILGQPGTGKTWMELVIVRAALKEGYRVLFITKEMEPEQIATRMDAALLGLPFDQIRRGLLGDDAEKRYFEELHALADRYSDFIISADEGEGGVTEIQAKIEEHNPDLLVIDGSYLIVDEDGGESQHAKALNICRRLKRLARKTQIPIYNATQAGRQTKRSKAPDMEDVSFTYAYAQDSDVIISVYRTEEMHQAGKLGIKMVKVREGSSDAHYVLNWDFDRMDNFGTLATDMTMSEAPEEEENVMF